MKTIMTAAALMAGIAGISESAKAHSFNVGMVIALAEPSIADAAQVRNGFLLSTRERDSHPDEESDGHLGGAGRLSLHGRSGARIAVEG